MQFTSRALVCLLSLTLSVSSLMAAPRDNPVPTEPAAALRLDLDTARTLAKSPSDSDHTRHVILSDVLSDKKEITLHTSELACPFWCCMVMYGFAFGPWICKNWWTD